MPSSPVEEGRKMASAAASKVIQDVIRERDQAIHRTSSSPIRKKDDPIESLVRIGAASIGFVSEVYKYRQDKNRSIDDTQIHDPQIHDQSQQLDNTDADISRRLNKTVWNLDDAAQESAPPEIDSQPPKESTDLAKAFLERHPYQSETNPGTKLALPVILTQRRPKTRARGFIRAYSPVLADAGIDQQTFLDFIDTFNKALEPNPWLYALNLAGLAGLAVPEPLMMLLGVGVGVATDAVMEVQSRFKSNAFLDSINAEFFTPRGMLCIPVSWNPDAAASGELMTAVDFEGRVVGSRSATGFTQKMKDIITQKISTGEGLKELQGQVEDRLKSSTTIFEWPDPAPLIFPSPNETAAAQRTDTGGKKKGALDRAEIWLDEYIDKHAQAKWIAKNGDHPMAHLQPRPKLRSRYADPNHPAASGDIVAFLTAGSWQSGPAINDGRKASDVCGEREDDMLESATLKVKSPASKTKSAGGFMTLLQRDLTDSEIDLLQHRYWEKPPHKASKERWDARRILGVEIKTVMSHLEETCMPLYEENEAHALGNVMQERFRRTLSALQVEQGATDGAMLARAWPWVRRLRDETRSVWGYGVFIAPGADEWKLQNLTWPSHFTTVRDTEGDGGLEGRIQQNIFLVVDQDAVDSMLSLSGNVDDMWMWAVDPDYTAVDTDRATGGEGARYRGFMRVRVQKLLHNFFNLRHFHGEESPMSDLWAAAQQSRGGLIRIYRAC